MEKGIAFATLFFLIGALFVIPVYADLQVPQDLLDFYAHNITHLTLSNSSLLLYDKDRTQFYYMYYNAKNTTLNITTTVECVSSHCPSPAHILIDYLQTDNTTAHVKKAAGVFIMTNNTELGRYEYNITLSDPSNNYRESSSFRLEVISSSLWRQFWHNLLSLFA